MLALHQLQLRTELEATTITYQPSNPENHDCVRGQKSISGGLTHLWNTSHERTLNLQVEVWNLRIALKSQ